MSRVPPPMGATFTTFGASLAKTLPALINGQNHGPATEDSPTAAQLRALKSHGVTQVPPTAFIAKLALNKIARQKALIRSYAHYGMTLPDPERARFGQINRLIEQIKTEIERERAEALVGKQITLKGNTSVVWQVKEAIKTTQGWVVVASHPKGTQAQRILPFHARLIGEPTQNYKLRNQTIAQKLREKVAPNEAAELGFRFKAL